MSEENNIPTGWKIVDLKSITDSIQYGYTESSSKDKIGPKFLRITDIQDNKVQWDDVPYCKIDNNLKDKYLLKDGDLVFARTGATVGKSFLIKGDIPEAVFASYLIRVRVNQKIDEKYLSYFFHSPNYWSQITEGQVGIGQPNVNGTKLGQLKISIAPLEQQQSIVSKIEELLSDLENGKQQLILAQQQLKIYRQSLLKWAFEGKLTNKNVKDGELPKGWKIKELIDCAEMCLGKMLDKSKNKGNYQYYLRNISVRWGCFDLEDLEQMRFEESEEDRYGLKKGDLIICEGGEPGRCAIWKDAVPNMKIQKALHRVRVKNELSVNYLFHFMYYSGMSGLLEKYFTGTTIKHLTGTQLKKIEIPLPPIAEQQLIVDELESKLTVCDKIEETISQSLLQSESLRQSILKKAFEGKLI